MSGVSTTLTVTATAGKATATRLPVPDDDVPVQVSSIPQELLRQQATNTLMEALKNASGVQAIRWYGVYEQFTIRGFNDPDRDAFNVVRERWRAPSITGLSFQRSTEIFEHREGTSWGASIGRKPIRPRWLERARGLQHAAIWVG